MSTMSTECRIPGVAALLLSCNERPFVRSSRKVRILMIGRVGGNGIVPSDVPFAWKRRYFCWRSLSSTLCVAVGVQWKVEHSAVRRFRDPVAGSCGEWNIQWSVKRNSWVHLSYVSAAFRHETRVFRGGHYRCSTSDGPSCLLSDSLQDILRDTFSSAPHDTVQFRIDNLKWLSDKKKELASDEAALHLRMDPEVRRAVGNKQLLLLDAFVGRFLGNSLIVLQSSPRASS
jgi:hypothetical protein